MTLYDVLGITKDATREDVRNAYKKKAMNNHPDKGGDVEQFLLISLAHKILTDDQKRANYDETGDYSDKVDDLESQAYTKFILLIDREIFEIIKSGKKLVTKNIITKISLYIKNNISEAKKKIVTHKEQEIKIKSLLKKFRYNGKKNNIIDKLSIKYHEICKQMINEEEYIIKLNEKILELLGDYEFEVDKEEVFSIWNTEIKRPPFILNWSTMTE